MATHACGSCTGGAETVSCLEPTDSHLSLISEQQVPVRDPGSKTKNERKWTITFEKGHFRLTSSLHTSMYTYMNIHPHPQAYMDTYTHTQPDRHWFGGGAVVKLQPMFCNELQTLIFTSLAVLWLQWEMPHRLSV